MIATMSGFKNDIVGVVCPGPYLPEIRPKFMLDRALPPDWLAVGRAPPPGRETAGGGPVRPAS